jgi:hypothetical protein
VPSGEEGDIFDVAMKLSEAAAWGVMQKKKILEIHSAPFCTHKPNQTKPNQTTKTKTKTKSN